MTQSLAIFCKLPDSRLQQIQKKEEILHAFLSNSVAEIVVVIVWLVIYVLKNNGYCLLAMLLAF